ncbi:MAG: Gldg family protein [Xanthomonadales bacterium]|nr:Gldg family protein [Xanthomonadales bacterium]
MNTQITKKYSLLVVLVIVLSVLFIYLEKNNQQFSVVLDDSHALNQQTIKILQTLKGEKAIQIDIYTDKSSALADKMSDFFQRFQRVNSDIGYQFINPTENPDQVRLNAVSMQGEMVLSLKNSENKKSVNITELSESAVINSILRLLNPSNQWIVFAEGFGMSKIDDESPSGLSNLLIYLKKTGLQVARMPLNPDVQLPEQVKLIIFPGPTDTLSDEMTSWILSQMNKGVSIWWLTDTFVENQDNLELAFDILSGEEILNDDKPFSDVVSAFGNHPITENFNQPVYLAGIREIQSDQWNNLLQTEKGKSLFLARQYDNSRAVISGDVDFISNQLINVAANKAMILRIIDWLTDNDKRLNLPITVNSDTQLYLTQTQLLILSVLLMIVIPLVFLSIAFKQWRKARV